MFGCVQTFWTRCHINGVVVTLAATVGELS